jgi:hypothetical protein
MTLKKRLDFQPHGTLDRKRWLVILTVLFAVLGTVYWVRSTALAAADKPRKDDPTAGHAYKTQIKITWQWYGFGDQTVNFDNPFGGIMRLEVKANPGGGIREFSSDICPNKDPKKEFIFANKKAWIKLLGSPQSGTATATITPPVPEDLPKPPVIKRE